MGIPPIGFNLEPAALIVVYQQDDGLSSSSPPDEKKEHASFSPVITPPITAEKFSTAESTSQTKACNKITELRNKIEGLLLEIKRLELEEKQASREFHLFTPCEKNPADTQICNDIDKANNAKIEALQNRKIYIQNKREELISAFKELQEFLLGLSNSGVTIDQIERAISTIKTLESEYKNLEKYFSFYDYASYKKSPNPSSNPYYKELQAKKSELDNVWTELDKLFNSIGSISQTDITDIKDLVSCVGYFNAYIKQLKSARKRIILDFIFHAPQTSPNPTTKKVYGDFAKRMKENKRLLKQAQKEFSFFHNILSNLLFNALDDSDKKLEIEAYVKKQKLEILSLEQERKKLETEHCLASDELVRDIVNGERPLMSVERPHSKYTLSPNQYTWRASSPPRDYTAIEVSISERSPEYNLERNSEKLEEAHATLKLLETLLSDNFDKSISSRWKLRRQFVFGPSWPNSDDFKDAKKQVSIAKKRIVDLNLDPLVEKVKDLKAKCHALKAERRKLKRKIFFRVKPDQTIQELKGNEMALASARVDLAAAKTELLLSYHDPISEDFSTLEDDEEQISNVEAKKEAFLKELNRIKPLEPWKGQRPSDFSREPEIIDSELAQAYVELREARQALDLKHRKLYEKIKELRAYRKELAARILAIKAEDLKEEIQKSSELPLVVIYYDKSFKNGFNPYASDSISWDKEFEKDKEYIKKMNDLFEMAKRGEIRLVSYEIDESNIRLYTPISIRDKNEGYFDGVSDYPGWGLYKKGVRIFTANDIPTGDQLKPILSKLRAIDLNALIAQFQDEPDDKILHSELKAKLGFYLSDPLDFNINRYAPIYAIAIINGESFSGIKSQDGNTVILYSKDNDRPKYLLSLLFNTIHKIDTYGNPYGQTVGAISGNIWGIDWPPSTRRKLHGMGERDFIILNSSPNSSSLGDSYVGDIDPRSFDAFFVRDENNPNMGTLYVTDIDMEAKYSVSIAGKASEHFNPKYPLRIELNGSGNTEIVVTVENPIGKTTIAREDVIGIFGKYFNKNTFLDLFTESVLERDLLKETQPHPPENTIGVEDSLDSKEDSLWEILLELLFEPENTEVDYYTFKDTARVNDILDVAMTSSIAPEGSSQEQINRSEQELYFYDYLASQIDNKTIDKKTLREKFNEFMLNNKGPVDNSSQNPTANAQTTTSPTESIQNLFLEINGDNATFRGNISLRVISAMLSSTGLDKEIMAQCFFNEDVLAAEMRDYILGLASQNGSILKDQVLKDFPQMNPLLVYLFDEKNGLLTFKKGINRHRIETVVTALKERRKEAISAMFNKQETENEQAKTAVSTFWRNQIKYDLWSKFFVDPEASVLEFVPNAVEMIDAAIKATSDSGLKTKLQLLREQALKMNKGNSSVTIFNVRNGGYIENSEE